MARNEENTKAAIDNSDSNLIEAYDREIKRLEEVKRTLVNEFLDQPNKEFLAPDMWKFLEEYPQVKVEIKHYIRHRLEELWKYLYYKEMHQRYVKRIMELENNLKRKKMTLNYIDGCTTNRLTIDGVEASELPSYEIANVIRHLVGRCENKSLLKEMLANLVEFDKESSCAISPCDQRGYNIYNYKLEI